MAMGDGVRQGGMRTVPLCSAMAWLASTVVLVWAAPALPQTDVGAAKLARATLPAKGKHSTILTVDRFGRYSVTAHSAQGVALQLVDRMSGAGAIQGEAGAQDGRLDLFLDRGEYKVVTHAADKGRGQVTLRAHAYREKNANPALLVEHRLETGDLSDFEQRSYWIEITTKRTVALEVAARHLADLRLWREGTWLVDARPEMSTSQATQGQPLRVARLSAELEPGLYLLTAYGGPSLAWTEQSDAKPFYLRYGIPILGSAGRQRYAAGAFGVERFLVPKGTNYFRLELPQADAATIEVSNYDPRRPFDSRGASASISKNSLPPVAEMQTSSGADYQLVTVRIGADKSFVLQHFESRPYYTLQGAGEYWLSTIHSGAAEDSVGATAILTRQPRLYGERPELVEAKAVDMTSGARWRRRFNLLDPLTLFVNVQTAGKYQVVGGGTKAHYRFEPFLVSRPRDYQEPPWRDSGFVFELDAGLYVLHVEPELKGILDLQLLYVEPLLTTLLQLPLLAGKPPPSESFTPVVPAVRFSVRPLEQDRVYTVYVNRQPGVASGLVVRQLPIDLAQGLPVTQFANESLTIPVRAPERGVVKAITEEGRPVPVAVDGAAFAEAKEIDQGTHRIAIRPSASRTQSYSLIFEPTRLASTTALPALPDARLAGLPRFPVLDSSEARFLDLKRNSSATYQVRVATPALYRLESSGLLQTEGNVRTRTKTSLFREAANGVGRNFRVQQYLREGDYQLTVSTQGQTEGHLGLQLAANPIVDGGELRDGIAARALLPAGQALSYRFNIARRGTYRLQAFGLGRDFDMRLEDNQGWPVFAPSQRADLVTSELEPGRYRLIVLPKDTQVRVISQISAVATRKRLTGHGPHVIALNSRVEHTWREPDGKNARVADQWDFALPAPASVTLALDHEMEGELVSVAQTGKVLARVSAARPWEGRLDRGRYRLLARHSRRNNHVAYSVSVNSRELLAGQSRVVAAPATIPVAVGVDGLVELYSFGRFDVRARLYSEAGELVAQNDDRMDDWNFHIAQRLAPGAYRLVVDPVNERSASTTVIFNAAREVAEKPLALGNEIEVRDAQVHVYPLTLPAGQNLLVLSARSSDVVGISLEGESGGGWVNLGSDLSREAFIVLPLAGERLKSYRARVWSVDKRALSLRAKAQVFNVPVSSETQLAEAAVSGTQLEGTLARVRVAAVSVVRPGVFRLSGEWEQWRWSDSPLHAAQASIGETIAVQQRTLWLASSATESGAFSAARVRPATDDDAALRLDLPAARRATIDLAPNEKGPSLVIAESRQGQPGLATDDSESLEAIGLASGAAVAMVRARSNATATVWNAGHDASPFETDLRQVPLQETASQTLADGVTDGILNAREARPMKLPGGEIRVRLALPPMSAAVFMRRGGIVATYWSGSEALYQSALTTADGLWLLNSQSNAVRFSLEMTPAAGESEPVLKAGELFERNLATAGRIRLQVEGPKGDEAPYTLRVRGALETMFVENGGRIVAGDDIAIRNRGVLWMRHASGALVAWIETPNAQGAARLADWFHSLKETSVRPPAAVTLSGKSQALRLTLDQPAMLHVRTHAPVVTHFTTESHAPQTEAYVHGAQLNVMAPAGSSRLLLQAIGSDELSGVATVITTPVTSIDEGLGPEVLVAPAGARLFAFVVQARGPVGIGVRASSDVVRGVLYDARGVKLAEGVVQMPELDKGTYYLAVLTPADSAPVRVQPVLVGLKKPDTRPPFEVLRRFVEGKINEPLIYAPGSETPVSAPDESERATAMRRNATPEQPDEDAASGEPEEPDAAGGELEEPEGAQ